MRRLAFIALVVCLISPLIYGADYFSIVDYFRLLPENALETPAASWLPLCDVIDKTNGYMHCPGDGAQAEFEVALFRFKDGRPLLAISSGELEGCNSLFLEFYQLGKDAHMKRTPRGIFPIKDGDGRQFKLPRNGRTISILNKSGKVLNRFTWDGTKFQSVK
ncbi:MAG: hypothetical protein ABIP97_08215 [Chthoniobacterales bacterium]